MSEEAKEKAGGGKGAHRKKKGKKVRERGRAFFLCLGVLGSVVASAVLEMFVREVKRLLGEVAGLQSV